MRRRDLLAGLGATIACGEASLAAEAVPLVAVLRPGSSEIANDAFRRGLRELGYTEGRNIALAVRFADGDYGRLPALAAELVALRPKVIVTNSAPAIRAAKEAAGAIPIVMAIVDDPVAIGFAQSLAHPGGNLTGLTILAAGVLGKRLQLLHEIMPEPGCVAVLGIHSREDEPGRFGELVAAANALGITLQPVWIADISALPAGFAEIDRHKCRALLAMSDPLFAGAPRRLVELAARHRIAASYDNRQIVEAGGLMSYGPDTADMHRRSAAYVDKILKGQSPADLPIEQPTKFHLALNLRAAKGLGLAVSPLLLAQADEVLE